MGFAGPEVILTGLFNPVVQGVRQGVKANRQQKRANAAQEQAQKEAQTLAERQMRENAEQLRRANARRPDITSLLSAAQGAASRGANSTLLTGAGGVDPDTLKLGRASLLGS